MTRMVPRTFLVMWMANVAALGQAGVVREWQALLSTRDGVSAAEHLLKKWQPERMRLERMKSNIDQDCARLTAENRDKLRWLPWRAAGRNRLEAGSRMNRRLMKLPTRLSLETLNSTGSGSWRSFARVSSNPSAPSPIKMDVPDPGFRPGREASHLRPGGLHVASSPVLRRHAS
jgi:hypothetical protein